MILLLLLLIILFGFGGPWYGSRYETPYVTYGGGSIGIVLLIVLILFLLQSHVRVW